MAQQVAVEPVATARQLEVGVEQQVDESLPQVPLLEKCLDGPKWRVVDVSPILLINVYFMNMYRFWQLAQQSAFLADQS